jgi:hypothetical protein
VARLAKETYGDDNAESGGLLPERILYDQPITSLISSATLVQGSVTHIWNVTSQPWQEDHEIQEDSL